MSAGTDAPSHCEICGRGPAIDIHASMYRGLGVFGDELFWKGRACRECAIAQYRTGLTHCLWAGWWSPVALFVNPFMIGRDVVGLGRAHRAAEPEGTPRAAPMEVGPPMWRRPRAWLGPLAPLAVVVAVVATVWSVAGRDPLDGLRVGQCLDLPAGRVVADVDVVDCDGLHDAEVTAVLPADSMRPCDDRLIGYVGDDDPLDGVRSASIDRSDPDVPRVCLLVSADGSPLTGSQRRTG